MAPPLVLCRYAPARPSKCTLDGCLCCLSHRRHVLSHHLIGTPDGAQVPLSEVVSIHSVLGPPMIRSESGKLVGFVFVDTDRPIADYVAEAKQVVGSQAKLPPGTRLDWVGQFKYFERAKERLKWVIPLTLGIVFLLLYLNTQSLAETVIVMLAVPFSLSR